MGRYLFFAVFFGFLVGAFQNCGKVAKNSGPGDVRPQEVVIGSTEDYYKVSYDADAGGGGAGFGGVHDSPTLELNIITGELAYGGSFRGPSGISPVCRLSSERQQQLDRILSQGSLCEPAPLAADEEVCMAIGINDILLEGEPEIQAASLRPVICHNGVFLCEGQDVIFREILASLLENRPAGCE